MANIQTELNRFKTSVYGEEIRDSLISSVAAINEESENSKTACQEAKQLAENANVISTAVGQRIDLVGSCKPGETMTDAFPGAPRSMVLYGSSVQDGVPSPSAPIPIKSTDSVSMSGPFAFTFNLSLHGIKNNKGAFIARDIVDFSRGVLRRECAKLELDGTESWATLANEKIPTYYFAAPGTKLGYSTSLCTHFVNKDFAWTYGENGTYSDHDSAKLKYFLFNGTLDEWKAYLAAQKDNGTPVTLIYCLAVPKEERLLEGTMEQYRALRHGGGDLPFAAKWSGTPGQLEMSYTQDVARSIRRLQMAQVTATQLYGVRFESPANNDASVKRLYSAAGKVAGVGTDTQAAVNDFDNVYPWSARRRCCGYFDSAGNFVVNAYEGEIGYAADGSNGEVWVEHSLFFYKHTYTGDAEEIVISPVQLPGFLPAPIFVKRDGSLKQKAYTAAYPMATVNGKATSRSGVFTDAYTCNLAVQAARALGSDYTVTTAAQEYTKCLYMWVEFATRNVQLVMMGACTLRYVATDTAKVTETAANRIIITKSAANYYVTGQTIGVGTTIGNSNIANNRIITCIEDYDEENKAIVFDGAPVNIAVGNIVFSFAWINGSCDGVLSSSGSPVSNTSGRYNCVYRGEEAPYGNAHECISDVLFKRQGAGTTEIPYSYDIYHLPDPSKYANGAITPDYIKLNYQLPKSSGHVKKLGLDSRYPGIRLPCENGADAASYYADYYSAPIYEICAAFTGGYWSNGVSAGICCWYCNYAPMQINISYHARLSHI